MFPFFCAKSKGRASKFGGKNGKERKDPNQGGKDAKQRVRDPKKGEMIQKRGKGPKMGEGGNHKSEDKGNCGMSQGVNGCHGTSVSLCPHSCSYPYTSPTMSLSPMCPHLYLHCLYFYPNFRSFKGMNRNFFVSRPNQNYLCPCQQSIHVLGWVGRTFFGGISTQLSPKSGVLPQSIPIWLWKMCVGQGELKGWIYVGEALQGHSVLLDATRSSKRRFFWGQKLTNPLSTRDF